MGSLISLNVVITNNLTPEISSFFFCTLLFYLFFEVFFSFFRKLYEGKSPIYPDDKHLHMLSFYKLSAVYGRDKDYNGHNVIKETTLDKRTTHWVKERQIIGV